MSVEQIDRSIANTLRSRSIQLIGAYQWTVAILLIATSIEAD